MSFSSYEPGFATANSEPCTCPSKSTGYTTSSTIASAPDAHFKPTHFLTGLANIQHPTGNIIGLSSSKFNPFVNNSETNGFSEPYPPQGFMNFSNSNLTDPTNLTPMPSRKRAEKPPAHVKKPLNAFMLFMKEMRAKVVAECTMKESAAINQILGRKWHALPHEEQAKFYEMARKEKELHQRMYPGWSARDNYAYHAKRRKNRCRYRVYNSISEQAKDGSLPANNQEAILMDKTGGNLTGSASTGLSSMLKCSAFYRCPFSLGNMANGNQCYSSTDDIMPYFGFIDRNQQQFYQDQYQQQQIFGLGSQQTDLDPGTKEDCKPRKPGSFSECIEPNPTTQHFNPPSNWLLGNSHHPQISCDVISSPSTSPWSQAHHQPSCVSIQNDYSTPPYNPNGSFDCCYNETNHSYLASQKASPAAPDPHSSLKISISYPDSSIKPTLFQSEYGESDCGGNSSSTAPVYGFSST
ncbi:hypothetical protein Aperf_G00000002903 [Anoplocephala perfoliata]